MKKVAHAVVVLSVVLLGRAAWAHEGEDHSAHGANRVMGTVTAVDRASKHIEVKEKEGGTVSVAVDDATKYLKGTAAAKLEDVAVGSRVVVQLSGQGQEKVATEVKMPAAEKEPGESKGKASEGAHDHKH